MPQTFSTTSNPTVVITSPVPDSTVTTTTPYVAWLYGSPAGRPQVSYRIDIFENDVSIYAGSAVVSATASAVLPGGYLVSGNTYRIAVTVTDSGSFSGTSSVTIHCLTVAPAAVAGLVATPNHDLATVSLSWAVSVAPLFVRYEIRRSTSWETGSILIASITTQAQSTFIDYFAPSGGVLTYTITQVVNNAGAFVAYSAASSTTVTLVFRNSWLVDVVDPTYQVQLIDSPARSSTIVRDEAQVQYWGDRRPVTHIGNAIHETIQLSGRLIAADSLTNPTEDETSSWRMFKTLVQRKNIVCYRDGRGRRLFGTFTYSDSDQLPFIWNVSISFTETEYEVAG